MAGKAGKAWTAGKAWKVGRVRTSVNAALSWLPPTVLVWSVPFVFPGPPGFPAEITVP